MAITAVSVTKSATWRGATEKWSNVYHYFSAANLDVTTATDLVNQIATAEKLCHANNVTFEDGRAWSAGGAPSANETIVIVDLSGTGSLTGDTSYYIESTLVARCDTNRNTATGKRIYLRKYYHTLSITSGTAGMHNGSAALGTTQKAEVKTCLETLREVLLTGGVNVQLCAPGGQIVSDSRPVTVLDYVHTRQFRR